jgi:hypothetical protein
MNKKKQSKTVNKEAFRMLAVEIGLNAACRKLDVPIPTGKSWARRGGWKLPKRPGGRPGRKLTASGLHPIADALVATHKELETTTKTALARATAAAAEHASTQPPLEVRNPAQLRDLAVSATKVFGWDKKGSPHTQFNQLVISAEQVEQIRAAADGMTPEESEEVSRKVLEMTPQEKEEFRRRARELLGGQRNMEDQTLPAPSGFLRRSAAKCNDL